MNNLPGRPEDVQLETPESAERALKEQMTGRSSESNTGFPLPSPISFMAAMRIPNVISYALAFGFLKVNICCGTHGFEVFLRACV